MTESAKTADDAPEAKSSVTASNKQIRSALLRYRVLAWVTGVWLLLLVAEMVVVALSGGWTWWQTGLTVVPAEGGIVSAMKPVPFVHGWIYFVYLICTVDLSIKARWSLPKLVLTAIAGTIPFLSFWFEHIRTREVKEEFGIE